MKKVIMISSSGKALANQRFSPKFSSSLSLGISLFTISVAGFLLDSLQAKTVTSPQQPTIARVKKMTNGDISCYVDLVDQAGKVYEAIPASFEICRLQKTFLNKKVSLIYTKERVSDCQSIEPCGKTKIVTLITKMKIIP